LEIVRQKQKYSNLTAVLKYQFQAAVFFFKK